MDDAHLDIVEREQSDHGVVFALVPIFVDLFPDENDVAFPERQFPARKLYKKKKKTRKIIEKKPPVRTSTYYVVRLTRIPPNYLEVCPTKLYRALATSFGSGVRLRGGCGLSSKKSS